MILFFCPYLEGWHDYHLGALMNHFISHTLIKASKDSTIIQWYCQSSNNWTVVVANNTKIVKDGPCYVNSIIYDYQILPEEYYPYV